MHERFRFTLQRTDGTARAAVFRTPHGEVHTPAFMVVGTQAAVRAMTPAQVRATGAEVVLANTYHLTLRPGEGLIENARGHIGNTRNPQHIHARMPCRYSFRHC